MQRRGWQSIRAIRHRRHVANESIRPDLADGGHERRQERGPGLRYPNDETEPCLVERDVGTRVRWCFWRAILDVGDDPDNFTRWRRSTAERDRPAYWIIVREVPARRRLVDDHHRS